MNPLALIVPIALFIAAVRLLSGRSSALSPFARRRAGAARAAGAARSATPDGKGGKPKGGGGEGEDKPTKRNPASTALAEGALA